MRRRGLAGSRGKWRAGAARAKGEAPGRPGWPVGGGFSVEVAGQRSHWGSWGARAPRNRRPSARTQRPPNDTPNVAPRQVPNLRPCGPTPAATPTVQVTPRIGVPRMGSGLGWCKRGGGRGAGRPYVGSPGWGGSVVRHNAREPAPVGGWGRGGRFPGAQTVAGQAQRGVLRPRSRQSTPIVTLCDSPGVEFRTRTFDLTGESSTCTRARATRGGLRLGVLRETWTGLLDYHQG